jgi:hypothetical protein
VAKAFIGFAKGWNSGFGKWVERYECLPIPEQYKNISMGYDTPLVFCLANQENEGICPLALTQSMCEMHNGFLASVRDKEKKMVHASYYS